MIKYYWIFSDGKISTEKDPVYTFAYPGYHKVSLNTFNELSGCMDYNEKIILIGSQGKDCEADFIYVADESNNTVTFSDQSQGKGLTWFWNFGDGDSSLIQNPVHQYKEGGFHNVCLTVYSSTGIQDISCKQIFAGISTDKNCLARFDYTVDNIKLEAVYKDKSFGTPDLWLWTFGDGQSSDIQNPAHGFARAGYYITRENIINQSAGCTSNAFTLVNINMGGGFIARFGYTIDSISRKAESYPVDYVGISLGDASKYKWSFGDGTYDSTTTTPTHIYATPGTYEVCLTVYDVISGTENTICESVTVGGPNYFNSLFTGQDIILQCYPNPADERYYILFDLPSEAYVAINVYTVSGKKLQSAINKKLDQGRHVYELDASDLANGLYIIKLYSDIRTATQIMSIQH